jgi:hypothetical protein
MIMHRITKGKSKEYNHKEMAQFVAITQRRMVVVHPKLVEVKVQDPTLDRYIPTHSQHQ